MESEAEATPRVAADSVEGEDARLLERMQSLLRHLAERGDAEAMRMGNEVATLMQDVFAFVHRHKRRRCRAKKGRRKKRSRLSVDDLPADGLLRLPNEMLVQVFVHVGPDSAARLQRCCRRLRDLIATADRPLWKRYCDESLRAVCSNRNHAWLEATHDRAAHGPFWMWLLRIHRKTFSTAAQCCGEGRWIDDDGHIYCGSWRHGRMTGRGCAVAPGRWEYVGPLVDRLAQGEGRCTFVTGDQVRSEYTGAWVNDRRTGRGRATYPDGRCYDGDWEDNSWKGQGTLVMADGGRYRGGFEQGQTHGRGTWTAVSGETYDGEWRKGKWHGDGVATWPAGASSGEAAVTRPMAGMIQHRGRWRDHAPHGLGWSCFAGGTVLIRKWGTKKETPSNLILPDRCTLIGCFDWRTTTWRAQLQMVYPNGDAALGEWRGQGVDPRTFCVEEILRFDPVAPRDLVDSTSFSAASWIVTKASYPPLFVPQDDVRRDAFLAYVREHQPSFYQAYGQMR